MKYILAVVLVIVLLGVWFRRPGPSQVAPTSDAQFLKKFESSLKAKDKDAVMALFNWQDVSVEMKSFYSLMISEFLKIDVENVIRSPIPENFPATLDGEGVHYGLNVDPVGVLDVQSNTRKINLMQLPYGKKGGVFYIACLTEELVASRMGARTITVQLVTTDGKLLPDRLIVCANPTTIPNLQFGSLFGGMKRLRSDENGRLTIPLDAPNLFLVGAEPEGFGWIQNQGLTNNAVMVIRPWGRIEGVRKNRNQPVANEHLRLLPDQYFYSKGAFGSVTRPINNVGGNETWTDNSGKFTFEHVPPLKLDVVRLEEQGSSWAWPVEVKFGETNSLELATRGRTITGHVKPGPGLDANNDLAACSGTLVSDIKDQNGLRSSVKFTVTADGSIHAEGVEPGDYILSGELLSYNVRVAVLETNSVHIPEDVSDAENAPFDIGTFTLKEVPHLNAM